MTSVRDCIRACDAAGLDIAYPFSVGWYNRAAASGDALPDFGRRAALGVLVGNTRALWEPLRAAVRADAALRDDPNPLDTFVTRAVREAVATIDARTLVRWTHVTEPAALPIPRLRNPCESCHRPCLPALEEALRTGNGLRLEVAARTEWRRWVRVREVCPEGTEYRYGERQIEYHYTKERAGLTKQ